MAILDAPRNGIEVRVSSNYKMIVVFNFLACCLSPLGRERSTFENPIERPSNWMNNSEGPFSEKRNFKVFCINFNRNALRNECNDQVYMYSLTGIFCIIARLFKLNLIILIFQQLKHIIMSLIYF